MAKVTCKSVDCKQCKKLQVLMVLHVPVLQLRQMLIIKQATTIILVASAFE